MLVPEAAAKLARASSFSPARASDPTPRTNDAGDHDSDREFMVPPMLEGESFLPMV